MSSAPKFPWQKGLADLSKYDWLTAVSLNRRHQRRSRDLRVAIALMQLADGDTCLAWPTQQSLADLSGLADPRQVREAIASLRGTGAIAVEKLVDLSDESQSALKGKRSLRGRAYRLKLFWAYETMEACRSPVNRRSEPNQLLAGRVLKRTDTVLQKRTDTVRSRPDYDSPANTILDTKDTKGGNEGNVSRLASTREINSYARAKEGIDLRAPRSGRGRP